MNKPYKIAYKTYFNSRLNEVSFHGRATHPLYVQLTYNRKTIFFKSSCFELYGQERYALIEGRKRKAPSLAFVAEREKALVGFAVDHCRDDFSFDSFRQAYRYYGTDLCQSTEEVLTAFLVLFFLGKEASSFGKALAEGSKQYVLYDVLSEAQALFTPAVYADMLAELAKAPPYMELYGFMQQLKPWPGKVLTAIEWEAVDTKTSFREYLRHSDPTKDAQALIARIDKWLAFLRRDIAKG